MNLSGKQWGIVAAIGLGAGILMSSMGSLLMVTIVSAAVASGVTVALFGFLQKKNDDHPATGAKPDPRSELRRLMDGLVESNLSIREAGLSDAVLARVEAIIDKLRGLLPDINERHPGNDLTWTINRMADDYLPRVINPYLALAPTERVAKQEELLHSLNGLESEVDNVNDLVESEKMGDFKAKAAFLRARFVQT